MEFEDLDSMVCVDCGAAIDPTREPTFSITEELVLCQACTSRRGGQWDATREKWSVAPRLEGLRFGGGAPSAP
jgi:hypothetical protein